MKNNLKNLTFLLLAVFTISLVSCKDDEVLLATLRVQVEYADAFTGLTSENLTVTITNTTDNSEEVATTSATGLAEFIDLAPGTYNISCSLDLTQEEAQAASGYYQELTLNAVENNVELFGGVETAKTLTLDGQPSADLLIKEFYYSGANDPTWGILFKDQFVEIYNNSNEVIYADGLYLASIVPQANGSSNSDEVTTLPLDNYIYADKITQVPGSGTDYPIQPGESIVIAFNAVDWTDGGAKSNITVDLSTADFELYAVSWLESLGRSGNAFFDIDNVDVPNMNGVYLNIENYGMLSWISTGASTAIFRNDNYTPETIVDPESSESNPIYYAKIAVEDVIDGIDMLANAESAAFKRLPSSIDAGFNYVDGDSYTSKSVRRKVAKEAADGRKILMDTNNSTNDFEAIDLPTPRSFGN